MIDSRQHPIGCHVQLNVQPLEAVSGGASLIYQAFCPNLAARWSEYQTVCTVQTRHTCGIHTIQFG